MRRWVLFALLVPLLAGCAPGLRDPVRVESFNSVLDLRGRDFSNAGPAIPQGWLWDADVLWSPEKGRTLATAPKSLGAPDFGGSLSTSLRARGGVTARATFSLSVLVDGETNYGVQIGAMPADFTVWANGVAIWKSGGAGTVLSIQPRDGRIDFVVNAITSDPLIGHSELNRYWVIGPADVLLDAERAERNGRTLQATFLFVGSLVFLGIAFLRPNRRTILPFVGFLVLCLLKLLVNVEQAQPLLGPVWPGIPSSFYLFLNHGLNLLPFPLFVLFLSRQFPEDVSFVSFLVIAAATAVTTVWELLPFVTLAMGMTDFYSAVMRSQWSFILNLYVVLVVLFIFERMYHVHSKKRPLSKALFYGGIGIGLIILLPIPLSYFLPVKYTFFLGWGVFLFLLILGFALIRLQVQNTEEELLRLTQQLAAKETLGRFVPKEWGHRLGHESVEALRPGDRRRVEAVFVQISSIEPAERWLPVVGNLAEARNALLVEWHDGTGLWALDSWPESALAFALEVQRGLTGLWLRYRIVLTKAQVEFSVLDAGSSWVTNVQGPPAARLAELDGYSKKYGASLLLDESVQDGLVIGGWRRHRPITTTGREIELYEAEEESMAEIKDRTLDTFETALSLAKEGLIERAIHEMVAVIRQNPFDRVALALLAEWGAGQ